MNAATHTVENGRNDDSYLILNESIIHDKLYYDLRNRTDLPSNL